mgnify:CR=1 FL=1
MELSTIAKNELDGEDKEVVETIQYIVIRLGNEQYGIDIRNIDNIVRMQSGMDASKFHVFPASGTVPAGCAEPMALIGRGRSFQEGRNSS